MSCLDRRFRNDVLWFAFAMFVVFGAMQCLADEPSTRPSAEASSASGSFAASIYKLYSAMSSMESGPGDRKADDKSWMNDPNWRPSISKTRPMSVSDPEKFAAYKARLKARREYALAQRRRIYGGRIHVYQIHGPASPMGQSAIQAGMLRQPPIPRPSRPRIRVTIESPVTSCDGY